MGDVVGWVGFTLRSLLSSWCGKKGMRMRMERRPISRQSHHHLLFLLLLLNTCELRFPQPTIRLSPLLSLFSLLAKKNHDFSHIVIWQISLSPSIHSLALCQGSKVTVLGRRAKEEGGGGGGGGGEQIFTFSWWCFFFPVGKYRQRELFKKVTERNVSMHWHFDRSQIGLKFTFERKKKRKQGKQVIRGKKYVQLPSFATCAVALSQKSELESPFSFFLFLRWRRWDSIEFWWPRFFFQFTFQVLSCFLPPHPTPPPSFHIQNNLNCHGRKERVCNTKDNPLYVRR